jgi:hypothetical protein
MRVEVARCGNCGSPDLDHLADRVLKCKSCGKLNEVLLETHTLPGPATCQIDECGIVAIGRCGACKRAFCGSHQAFASVLGRSSRIVDRCASCQTSTRKRERNAW